jgi:hypothetical protein
MNLTEEEKFFVAHFLLGSQSYVKPVFGKYISLYSYLDQTDEPIDTQEKQIKEDDWYFCDLLKKIYSQSNESTWKSVFKELDDEGFFDNEDFYNKFLEVANWLYSKDCLRYFFEAGKVTGKFYGVNRVVDRVLERDKEVKKQNERRTRPPLIQKSEKELEQDRINAIKLIYKGVGRSKDFGSNNNLKGDWGLKSRSKLDGDGNDWREQS